MINYLAKWTGGYWTQLPQPSLSGFCFDSRKVREGDIFVALKSERADGHNYVEKALESGACGAIVEEDSKIAKEHPELPLLVVKDTLKAFCDAALGWRRKVNPFVVGVTGSVGKSTTKEWIAALLNDYGVAASTIANFNNEIGLPYSILSMAEGTQYGVFEAGISHPNDMAPLSKTMEPNAAVITAIAPVHIEFFDSLKGIADEKAGLLRVLPEDGFAVLDSKGEFFEYLSSQAKCRSVGACVVEKGEVPPRGSTYVATVVDDAVGAFLISAPDLDSQAQVVLARPGRHNILDAVLAVAVARESGVPWDKIINRLGNLPSMDLRWQRFDQDGLHWICDCYNASPTSMAASLKAFSLSVPVSDASSPHRAFVLGDMFELGENAVQYHKSIASVLEEIPTSQNDILICVGTLAANYACEGFRGRIFYAIDSSDAAHILHREATIGTTVLLKASHGMHLELVPKRYHMPFNELDVENPRVLILGGGRSGNGAYSLLHKLGIKADILENNAPIDSSVTYHLAVVSPGIAKDHKWLKECETLKIPVVSELELGYRFWHGKILAVTGSKGKSSVVKLCQDALIKYGKEAIACGNYGTPLSEIAANYDGMTEWAIVEASSFQLEGVSSFRPDISIFLNLQADHLDRHGSLEEYAKAKLAIFNRFVAKSDLALIHKQAWHEMSILESRGVELLRAVEATREIANDVVAFGALDKLKGFDGAVEGGGYFDSKVLAPALSASAAALFFAGLDGRQIEKAVSDFEPLPHRMQIISEKDGVVFINDSKATSLSAMTAALEMANRPVRLIAGGRLKEKDLTVVKFLLPKYTKKVYLIGEAFQLMYDAWHNVVPCEICKTMDKAVESSFHDALEGEAVLLAPGCASFDQFKSYEERGEVFAKLVAQCLKKD